MFKFLFFTDTHHTAKNPVSRKDILFDTTIEKIKEIQQIGLENNVDAFLHGGDFFDSPDISDNVAGKIGKLYQAFPAPVIVIAGNHDIIGNNINTLNQTKLGLLGQLGIVKLLNSNDVIKFKNDNLSVQITGSPSDFGINSNKDMLILKEKEADVAIHMVHAMLLREDAQYGAYIPLREIQDKTVADITLSGDFHLGFDTSIYDGKYFINPGAVVRKYNFIEEMQRTVHVVLITVNDNKTIDVKKIPLKTAKSGEEVLDRQTLLVKKEYEYKLLEFKQSITTKSIDNVEIEKIIYTIAKQNNIDKTVVKEAIERVACAKQKLSIV